MKKLTKIAYKDEEDCLQVEEIASAVPVRTWEDFTKEVTFKLVLKKLVKNSPKNKERGNEHSRQKKKHLQK